MIENDQITTIIERRTQNWLPIGQWGPTCAGCRADEFRIDGYCSVECRDFHCDSDIAVLADYIRVLERRAHL